MSARLYTDIRDGDRAGDWLSIPGSRLEFRPYQLPFSGWQVDVRRQGEVVDKELSARVNREFLGLPANAATVRHVGEFLSNQDNA